MKMKENILEIIRIKENKLQFDFSSMFSIISKPLKKTKKDLGIFIKEECENFFGGFDAN